jgi:dipeptidyl aminopeptidase/acylaminoacyl peptidase
MTTPLLRCARALRSAILLLVVPLVAEAQPRRPIRADDMYRFKSVGAPKLSPDGEWIAYAISTIDSVKDARSSDLWMVKWDGSRTLRLTTTPGGESDPQWSPDGRWLSFIATREGAKTGQVWLLDRSGGEAQKLTDIAGGVSQHQWSPDSKRLVVIAHDPEPKDSGADSSKTQPKPIVIDRYAFKRDGDGYLNRLRDHLWLVDVATKAASQLTTGDFDDRSPRWSPDGLRIAFVSARAGTDPDRENNTDIFTVDATAGATPVALTTWIGDDADPVWSPDGATIAYLESNEPKFYAYAQSRIAVIPSRGGTPAYPAPTLDRDVEDLMWTADGRALHFLLTDDRAVHLATVDAKGGPVRRLLDGRRVVNAYDMLPSGRIVTRDGTSMAMAELHTLENGAQRALTHVNDSIMNVLQLGAVEDVQFGSTDGVTVGALLFKPPTFTPGTRYPTVLSIHGGPNGQDEHLFGPGASFERQVLAAQGYLVLAVNYRGSSGRGVAWKKAIFADWGNKEVKDLLAGVDHLIAQGLADPDKLGIGGWSYGGILTDYTIATTTRFKAAYSGAGSALQTSMYGSDQYTYQYENELGLPWKNKALWDKLSYPFWRADRITTPTLFLGGQSDFNVPIAGGEQMYQALRSLGVPTQMVIYPEQFHGITRPSFARDRVQRYVDWYGKYLQGTVMK